MLFTDKCQNFATDRILEAAFYIDTERGNYMKTIVVCDDVEIERLLLKEILCQYFEEINEEVSIVEYDSGETLIADVEEGYIAMDLLFLDICMKKLNGMETARKIREKDKAVIIIFITNMAEYAIQGYDVEARGFILKPVRYRLFSQQMDRALRELESKKVEYLSLQFPTGVRNVGLKDIFYMENREHYLHIHLEHEIITFYCTIKEMEKTNVQKAIKEYEQYVTEEQPKDAPYKRLCILYRKNNDLENEIRILNKAIEVLSKKKPGKEDWFEKRLAKLS